MRRGDSLEDTSMLRGAHRLFGGALALALLGSLPAAHGEAPTGRAPQPPAGRTSTPQVVDIALQGDILTGRYVDRTGRPIDGAVVWLQSGRRTLARTTTDVHGQFQIDGVDSGVYRLQCGAAAGRIRCWNAQSAPPNALADDITFQDGVVRGQAGLLLPMLSTKGLLTTAAAASAVVSGVSIAGVDLGEDSKSRAAPPTDNVEASMAPGDSSIGPAGLSPGAGTATGSATPFQTPTAPSPRLHSPESFGNLELEVEGELEAELALLRARRYGLQVETQQFAGQEFADEAAPLGDDSAMVIDPEGPPPAVDQESPIERLTGDALSELWDPNYIDDTILPAPASP
jgi:hypothetical protein